MKVNTLTIREMKEEDFELDMAWWGIPEFRRFTTTTTQPIWKNLMSSLKMNNRRDYMIIYNNRRIGRTCLIDHGDFEELSVYIGEISLHGQGLGKQAIQATLQQAVKPVRSKVRHDNTLSLKAFQSVGFKPAKQEGEWIWLNSFYDI